MRKFIGVKVIEAEEQEKHLSTMGDCEEGIQGYKVVYEDGYTSWSPKDVFDKAYRLTQGMTFGLAIEAMKKGAKVARSGWNGKGMFIFHVPANSYSALGNKNGTLIGMFQDDMVPYGEYIAMKTAQENVVPWLASQSDMLDEDWKIVE